MVRHLLFCLQILILQHQYTSTALVSTDDRFDCYPENDRTEVKCLSRGCIWDVEKKSDEKFPQCYYNASSAGYKMKNVKITPLGAQIELLTDSNMKFTYGTETRDFSEPTIDVEYQTENRMRVKIYDAKRERYEVPVQQTFPKVTTKPAKQNYDFTFTPNSQDKFSFQVIAKRLSRDVNIWDTSVGSFQLADQFLQLSTRIPTNSSVYGIGERIRGSFRHDLSEWKTIGLFSRDQFPNSEDVNLYGVHPFYMCVEEDGSAHGVLLLNSNAMDITLQPTPAITYRTIGGIMDFYFFFGPTPENVIQQYTELIGRPVMPSYWSLGFQISRWGYNSLQTVQTVVKRMNDYDIPLDMLYGDIDYMNRQLDFVIKNNSFHGLPDYVRQIKKKGIKYITILDPAISTKETPGEYQAFDLGDKLDIWIKNSSGDTLLGKVWPDRPDIVVNTSWPWDDQTKYFRAPVAFPDFFHENITMWWNKLIKEFHNTLEFDGLWIDMNEVANFVKGSIHGCPANNSLENPPYTPKIVNSLQDKTLCMSAFHQDGAKEYDYHSLYGWKQSKVTRQALSEAVNKRGIVISRSTYVSSGKYIGHWLGDNKSSWEDLHWSIIGMMDMSLFGIPYIGADICGFFNDADKDLCLRWMQLGAFYPMSRNHNGNGFRAQDPANFGADFANKSRSILHVRYNVLPYLYTLFYHAHTAGSTVVRPLFHEFPQDKMALGVDRQFLWGPALLITPVLEKGLTNVKAYFPNARWFEYYTFRELEEKILGKEINLEVPVDKIGLHIRGGYIIPMQDAANNTMHSRKNPLRLIVALDTSGKSSGSLFWDDGDALDSIDDKKHLFVKFNTGNGLLESTVVTSGYMPDLHFNRVMILGLNKSTIHQVTINGTNSSPVKVDSNGVLKLENLKLQITKSFQISWNSQTPSGSTTTRSGCTFVPLFLCAAILKFTFL